MLKIEIKNEKVRGFLVIAGSGIGKGGLRMTSDVSLEEIERLALVMDKKVKHYKLPFCGAKAGIVWDGKQSKKKLIKEFFSRLKTLGVFPKYYITAPDIGTGSKEIDYIAKLFGKKSATRKSKSIPHGLGMTGYGIVLTAQKVLGNLKGKEIGVIGYGNVGKSVVKLLKERGAIISISDVKKGFYPTEYIIGNYFDALIPCACSDVINEDNWNQIRAKIIIEGGNCQIAESVIPKLKKKGIKIIPDYVANAGGVIASWCELKGQNPKQALRTIEEKML